MDGFQLGQNIRRIRELRDLSQEYVASEIGLTQSQLSKIEKEARDISLATFERIAEVLGVRRRFIEDFDVERLLSHTPEENISPATAQKSEYTLILGTVAGGSIAQLPINRYYGKHIR